MVTPKIAIVVVNYNGKNDTLECLDSIRSINYENFEVVLVDNGSSDGSVAAITAHDPSITLIETGRNLGFAGANNVGIRMGIQQGAEYVFLLNNDTTVDPNVLQALLDASQAIGDKGILGAKIFYHAAPNLIWYAGASWDSDVNEFRHIGFGLQDSGKNTEIVETDYICGCALFVHAAALKHIGLLDERYFLIFEETDFCYRARRSGYRSFVVPNAKVWHKVSVSFGGANSALYNYFKSRNLLLWAEKNMAGFQRMAMYKRALIDFLRLILPPRPHMAEHHPFFSMNGPGFASHYLRAVKKKYSDPIIVAKRRGIFDYCLRRFGDCPDSIRTLGK
jgi:hypothetical protein